MRRKLPIALFATLVLFSGTDPARAEKATLVFAGDTAFGESYRIRPEPSSLSGNNRYLPSLKALRPLLGKAREVLVNLETPLALPGASVVRGKSYVHWADPARTLAALKAAGVTAASLANNHTMDLGAGGLAETLAALDRAGIARTGAGPSLESAEKPLLWRVPLGRKTIPVAILSGFEYRTRYDEKFDFYAGPKTPGVNPLDRERMKARIRSLKAGTPGLYVIVFPHWGRNYAWRSEDQARLAREMADAGADLVIGHGAHQLLEVERYRGKWILYGLGNFVFHSPGLYASKKAPPYSLVARLDLEENGRTPKRTLRLYPTLSDNRVTDFRSRPVSAKEFAEIRNLLLQRSDAATAAAMRFGRDPLGFRVEIALP